MKGKTVVITGGTSGIGEVAAEALAQMGARIILVARNKPRADATLALAYEHYAGESTHAPMSASRWAPGVEVGAVASAPPLAGFAPYLRVACALFPFAQDLVFSPDTSPPKTPSLWLGASVGASYAR